MIAEKFTTASVFAVVFVGVAAVLLSQVPHASAVISTSTSTVTGWLFPDGAHWNNGIGLVLYPLMGIGLMAGIGKVVGVESEFGVTLILLGLVIGGVLGMLSVNASNTNVIPFALVLIPSADLVIWMWRGGG